MLTKQSLSQHFRTEGTGRFLRALHRKGPPKYFAQGPPNLRPPLSKFTQFIQIHPSCTQIFPNFTQICPNFIQICLNFAQICLKKFARRCGRIPSSYATAPLTGKPFMDSPLLVWQNASLLVYSIAFAQWATIMIQGTLLIQRLAVPSHKMACVRTDLVYLFYFILLYNNISLMF